MSQAVNSAGKNWLIGDQENYKMELLEEDKSSELQERFLQVIFPSKKFKKLNCKTRKPFDTVVVVVVSTTICLEASSLVWQKSTKNRERKQSKSFFLSSHNITNSWNDFYGIGPDKKYNNDLDSLSLKDMVEEQIRISKVSW